MSSLTWDWPCAPPTLSSEWGADLLSAGAKDGGIPNANERLVMERGK